MQNWLKYYHPQNYELRPLELKRKSGWKKKKKNWSENWALGYTWYDCVKLTLQYSLFIWTHCLRFFLNNRCSKANHYLDHMLRVLRSVSRVMQSKSLDRSVRTVPTMKLLSKFSFHSSNIIISTCWVLHDFLYAAKKDEKNSSVLETKIFLAKFS